MKKENAKSKNIILKFFLNKNSIYLLLLIRFILNLKFYLLKLNYIFEK